MTHEPAMTLGPVIAGLGAALVGIAAPVGAAPLTAQEVCSEFAAYPTQNQFFVLTGQIMGQFPALTPEEAGQTFIAILRSTCPAEIPMAAAVVGMGAG